MIIFLIILGWAICVPISYSLCKNDFIKSGFVWTQGDRILCLFFSIATGPVFVFTGLFIKFIRRVLDNNEPAKW